MSITSLLNSAAKLGVTQGLMPNTDKVIPVSACIRNLFPEGAMQRGSTVVVSGSTTLALSTLATASAEGSWCAAVNMADLGIDAAIEMGVSLDHLALVPNAGAQWALVVSALIETVDVVLVRPPGRVRETDARRLVAKARESGSVLVPVVDDSNMWPLADVRLDCNGFVFDGLFEGFGYLSKPRLQVVARGKGRSAQPRQALIALAS